MYEASAISLLMLIGIVCLSYDIGSSLIYALPKQPFLNSRRQVSLLAFTLSPFVASFCAILALALGPFLFDKSALLIFWCLLLALVIALRFAIAGKKARFTAIPASSGTLLEVNSPRYLFWFFGFLLAAWLILVLMDSTFLPLTQNDALEYLTVANLIADHHSLWVYPAIDPNLEHSRGFFGPWTHPPTFSALLAILNLVQGGASSTPGILRLVSPWFLLSAVCGIYVLGRLRSELSGLAAAGLLVSMPLLSLGAGSSLIDSLVVASITLVMLAIVCVDVNSRYRLALIGVSAGIGAWTHSQSLLLLPMCAGVAFCWFVLHGDGWKKTIGAPMLILGVAILIILLPYARNLLLFGSLVSDNPAVFALPELKWEEYVRASRGYVNWVDIVQYGLFKGWFLVEAYGIVFWLALLAIWPTIQSQITNLRAQREQSNTQINVEFVALALFTIYFLGVLLSILLGLIIMIKNERYLLIVAPAVSLLAAAAIEDLQSTVKRPWLGYSFKVLSLLALSSVLLYTAVYRLPQLLVARAAPYSISNEDKTTLLEKLKAYDTEIREKNQLQSTKGMRSSETDRQRISAEAELGHSLHFDPSKNIVQRGLMNWSNTWLTNSLEAITPPSARILAIRPADMYYARGRKMISFLDPRMLPTYKSTTLDAAFQELKKVGITHIQVPDYSTPIFFNTQLQYLLASPMLGRLVLDVDGNQLYELNPSGLRLGPTIELIDSARPWTIDHSWEIAARKSLLALGSSSNIQFGLPKAKDANLPISKRNMSTAMSSGLGANPSKTLTEFNASVSPNTEYILQLRLSGKSYVEASVHQYSASGQPIKSGLAQGSRSIKLMEFPVSSGSTQAMLVTKRFKTLDRSASMRLMLLFRGVGNLKIHEASLTELVR